MVIAQNLSVHAPAMALLAVPILLIIQHPVTSRLAVGLGSFSWLVWVGSVLTSIGVEAVYEVRWGWSLYLALLICSLAVVILRAAKAFWFLDRPSVGVRRAIETN